MKTIEQAESLFEAALRHFTHGGLIPNTDATRGSIGEAVYGVILTMWSRGEALMLADGARTVAARAVTLDFPDKIGIQWRTEFFPHARFGGQAGNCMPLGFFKGFDLYIGFQWPMPPVLIARYGSAPHEYETLPVLMVDDLDTLPAHFAAAYARAVQAGIPPSGGDEQGTAFFVPPGGPEITPLA